MRRLSHAWFNPFVTVIWWRRRTTWQNNGTLIHWFNPFVPEIWWRGGHRNDGSKNTLGRSNPVKTMTDVEDDGTLEDGSPRPVCTMIYFAHTCIAGTLFPNHLTTYPLSHLSFICPSTLTIFFLFVSSLSLHRLCRLFFSLSLFFSFSVIDLSLLPLLILFPHSLSVSFSVSSFSSLYISPLFSL